MITKSAAETRALGEKLAGRLQPGDVLLLEGDLGAGKSELTRGIAKGLGVTETVTSPSFTILNVYEGGRLRMYHFDWYRLQGAGEIWEAGLDEYLGQDGVTLIEWAERAPECVPERFLRVHFEKGEGDVRHISFQPQGSFPEMNIRGEQKE